MTNLSVLSALCTSLCSAFYPDNNVLELALFNAEISAEATPRPKDPELLKLAIKLVRGFVETSRSEGGVSVAIDHKLVDDNIASWAADYGLSAEDCLPAKTIEDGTYLW